MMLALVVVLAGVTAVAGALPSGCPAYDDFASQGHPPFSTGKYKYPSMRPVPSCRTFSVPEIEQTIKTVQRQIKDPDLFRLFQNTWPNTVDTTILWRGVSEDDPAEELAFVTTGDIHAMWLRDSANQLQSYKPILNVTSANDTHDIASLYRGTINLQARYISRSPFCNAFQPPPESKLPPTHAKRDLLKPAHDTVSPPYDPDFVFECKYELDSLAAFLQLSWDYYEATGDAAFFNATRWVNAVKTIVHLADAMMQGTYAPDGSVNPSLYTWLRDANSATETVSNRGAGNPVMGDIGLVRSFFRPSDDSTIYQYLIPSNMMFARYLGACVAIMEPIDAKMAGEMKDMAHRISKAIRKHGIVQHHEHGCIYAFEVDGFGSANLMDDANIPSLLSIPHIGFKPAADVVYRRTRAFALSRYNPYFAQGSALNGTGGPHVGPGMPWPMSVIMQVLTAHDDDEIVRGIKQIMHSTGGLGLIHESVNSHNSSTWTRPWFAWANGLFGQMILDILHRKPYLLEERSYQE